VRVESRWWRLGAVAATLVLAAPGRSQTLLDSARTRLAQLDGAFPVGGLDSLVEVRRDRWGVPHIYAKTQHDLFFAQGYVAAQDRLFQMEMWRRSGEGRLAEVLGPAAVQRDRFARLLLYRGDMKREWQSYAPDTREIVTAFTDGVNAYVDRVRDHPPVEFTLLGIVPTKWQPQAAVQRMAALGMTGNALTEVTRAKLVATLVVERAAQLWPLDPVRPLDPAPGLDLAGIDAKSLGGTLDAYGPLPYARREGSNNWVVSGWRTASGKPLLANDPHRAVSLPSLRYMTHLVGPGWNVIGAGEPALPGVAAGHNDRIAFGFTIVGMDQQDVYVERIAPCDPKMRRERKLDAAARCYRQHGEWKPLTVVMDTIRVRAEPPRVVRLEFTDHGPIVGEDTLRGRAFALRFVGTEPGTAGYLASLSVDRARDWKRFREAAARWKLPTENLVYADVDGHIGWVAAGLMPKRDKWTGVLPVPGDAKDDRYEWDGFLDMDDLPSSYDPASGYIVTANNNILPSRYKEQLNYEWAAPFRAQRIETMLKQSTRFTREDFERMQGDEYSIPAASLVPTLLAAARRRGVEDLPEIRRLAAWNYVMSRDAAAPLIFEAWLEELAHRVFAPRAGSAAAILDDEYDLPTLIRLVTFPDAAFGANTAAGRDSIALDALAAATKSITARLGPDRAKWRWGAIHRVTFRHPLAETFDLGPLERGGDANTVNATSGPEMRQTAGASYREIIDLADWDNSVAVNVPGQSGQPGSQHYGDLLSLWNDGRYFPLAYSRQRVERETLHLLILTPGGAERASGKQGRGN